MNKKNEFEEPKIEVVMFSVSSLVGTGILSGNHGGWEEEDDWIDDEY